MDEQDFSSDYCVDHACVIDGCKEGRVYDPNQDTHGDICATHSLKICAIANCLDWKTENGSFCGLHTCGVDRCFERIASDGRPFCLVHNKCTVPQCVTERLQLMDRFEDVCRNHYVPPCHLCPKKSSWPSSYCDLHSCRYKGCPEMSKPALGRSFCPKHQCQSQSGCHQLRSFIEADGELKINAFCVDHECKAAHCISHNSPDKPFCTAHCCTWPGCSDARDGDPRFGTLCYTHHHEKVEQKAKEEALEELTAKLHLNEEARKAAEESRRQARPRDERRSYYDTPRHEYYADYRDYDEGYRSNRNSDSHYQYRPSERGSGRG